MSTLPIDIRSGKIIFLKEEDVETLRGKDEISVNLFNYVLQVATMAQGQRDFTVVTSTDFIDKTVYPDVQAYKRLEGKKEVNVKSGNVFDRFRVLDKWDGEKIRFIIPLLKYIYCYLFIIDVSNSFDVVTYDNIIVYSIYPDEEGGRIVKNNNLTSIEQEALYDFDKWLSVCLEINCNTTKTILSLVSKRDVSNIYDSVSHARLLGAMIALKYYQDKTLTDVSFDTSEIMRLRNHLLKKLPIKERVHIVKILGREIYNILSGINVTNRNYRDVKKHHQLARSGSTEGVARRQQASGKDKTKMKQPKQSKALRRQHSITFNPSIRESEYSKWKRMKVEKMKEKVARLTEMINREEKLSIEKRDKSKNKKISNPSDELKALMYSSSDDSVDGTELGYCVEIMDDSMDEMKGGSQEENVGKNSIDDEVDIQEKKTSDNDTMGREGNIVNEVERGLKRKVLDPKNSRKSHEKKKTPRNMNLESDDSGLETTQEIITTEYLEDVERTLQSDNPSNIDDHVTTSTSNEDGYYEGPSNKKRKSPYEISNTTPDSACFVDPTFFPDSGTKLYSSIQEARREVTDYGVTSSYYVTISKSSRTYLRAYCKSHYRCPCHVQIGPVSDPRGSFKVKKIDRRHRDSEVITRGPGGRLFKQRNRIYATATYHRVDRNISTRPKPKDVMTSGRLEDGIVFSYSAGQRTVVKNRAIAKARADKSYQKLRGFLDSFARLNPGSVVDIQYDEYDRVAKVFVCPGIMNSQLEFVKRVVLIDACHRHTYRGTLYVATVFSANQEVYPIAVGLTAVNESEEGWTYFLSLLKQACPILSSVPDSSFIKGADILGFERREGEVEAPANDNGVEVFENDLQHSDGDVEEQYEEFDGDDDPVEDMDEDDTSRQAQNRDVFNAQGFATLGDVPTGTSGLNFQRNTGRPNQPITQFESDNEGNLDGQNVTSRAEEDDERKMPAVNNVNNSDSDEIDEDDNSGIPVFNNFETSGNENDKRENSDVRGQQSATIDNSVAARDYQDDDEGDEGTQVNETTLDGGGDGNEYDYDPNQQEPRVYVQPEDIANGTKEVDIHELICDMKLMIQYRSTYQWVFVSDRDKGMANAVSNVFPNIHPSNCSVHIRRNVLNAHGREASFFVPKISSCFSVTDEDALFASLALVNERAEAYLKNIRPSLWRNTAYMDPLLPPRYNILSSNGVESANNMFAPAREGPWLHAIQSVLFDMSTRIMEHRKQYSKTDGTQLVEKWYSILYDDFKAANSYKVLETTNDAFIVTYRNEDTTDGTMHKVKPSIATCSCGCWHQTLLPCRHAMAWARQVHNWSFETICRNMGCFVHFNKAGSQLYSASFDLAIIDSIRYNNTSMPNEIMRRAGRSSKQRYRPRCKFGNPDESDRTCFRCKRPGHNIRTCIVPDSELIGRHSVN